MSFLVEILLECCPFLGKKFARARLDFYMIDGDTLYLHLHDLGMGQGRGKYSPAPCTRGFCYDHPLWTFGSNNLTSTYAVGDKFGKIVHVDPSGMKNVYYAVITKGKIVKMVKLREGDFKTQVIEFSITQDMVPSFRLVVWAIYKDELLVDSLNIDIEDKCPSEAEVFIEPKFETTEPGRTGFIHFTGTKSTLFGILGVDKAVYALSEKDVLTRAKKMSQRRRLPNSFRWWAIGWMEMGLSQADVARRLNVSRSVFQRLWDQYQSEDSVSRRPVPGRPRATTPAEDRFLALSARRRRTTTVPQLFADHFQASGRRISATTVRNRLHNAGLYARRPVVCVPLNGRQRKNRLCWAREHVSWTQQQWASVLFTDESRFTMESDSGRLLIWRNSALDTINPTLLKDTVIEVVESWFGQGSRSVATLTCMCSMEEP
ncbi:HTH_Tnp_Tc3_2 domain-containing protein [Trichonephila clavipes]|nr:HTH_Tnp_Tc3_2 domain-containing protein [Trichonephila clavipes]